MKVICSNCREEYHLEELEKHKNDWNKFCGDKTLWNKWGSLREIYKDGTMSEPHRILSISSYHQDYISVNTTKGSYPTSEKTKAESMLKINGGGGGLIKLRLIQRTK